MSVAELREAYHTLRLAPGLWKYCKTKPPYGLPTYFNLRLGMVLSLLPAIWQWFIDKVFKNIQNRERYKIISDDAMAFSRTDQYFEIVLKYWSNLDWKISPCQCQFSEII